jgi:hypothetical protein
LLLLPFVSPSRDGKSSSNMETLLNHRDGTGGLFIGTSMTLLALMNSAPAELLHLLAHAALQPLLASFAGVLLRRPKKTPANACRRWNTVLKTPNLFSKKRIPCLMESGLVQQKN